MTKFGPVAAQSFHQKLESKSWKKRGILIPPLRPQEEAISWTTTLISELFTTYVEIDSVPYEPVLRIGPIVWLARVRIRRRFCATCRRLEAIKLYVVLVPFDCVKLRGGIEQLMGELVTFSWNSS